MGASGDENQSKAKTKERTDFARRGMEQQGGLADKHKMEEDANR